MNWRSFLKFGLAALIFLIFILYLARGWLRDSFVPFYVDKVYVPQIRRHYEEDFIEFDKAISRLGYRYVQRNAIDCSPPYFDGLSESVYCHEYAPTNKVRPSAAATAKWQQFSPSIERELLKNGWVKDNPSQSVKTLLNNTNLLDTTQQGVTYRKFYGKIYCNIDIINTPLYESADMGGVSIRNNIPSSRFSYVTKECSRTVSFFGGY